MNRQRLFVGAFITSLIAVPAAAQTAGGVEVGGFGQFTRADAAWRVESGFGLGGRIGYFLTSRWELEADASFATFTNKAPRAAGSTQQQTFAGRITYNLPFGMGGRTHQFIAGAGVGAQRFGGNNDLSLNPGAGFRFMFSDKLALRLDGVIEYVEDPKAATFGFPPTVGVNSAASRSTNLEIRAGLSFLTGVKRPAPPPAPVVATQQRETPPTRTEPAVQPQSRPPEAPRDNRDSIDAVNRARATLQAVVYFDFDQSELRDDQRAALEAKLPILRANPNVRIRIEGNADDRGSDEYNMALGMRRAQTAKSFLTNNGIDAGRIDIASLGEERPTCQQSEESCWSRNRRDEFVIVAGGDNMIAPRER